MSQSRRAARNPLADLRPIDYGAEVENERRAFDGDELRYLIAATASGPLRRGMDGLERALLYLLAVETGLRVAELCSLSVRNFELEVTAPLVWLHRQNTKNKRRAELPLRAATAELLKQRFRHKAPTAAAFPILPRPDAFATVFRQDLTAARQRWVQEADDPNEREKRERSDFLAETDRQGRRAVFHSLRHSSATLLAAAGVHVTVAQSLMRHSDVNLTTNVYTKVAQTQEAQAVAKLPDLYPAALSATGTTDENAHIPHHTPRLPRHFLASSGTVGSAKSPPAGNAQPPNITVGNSDSTAGTAKATSEIRTPDLCFTKALTKITKPVIAAA